jgi:hypothetical protein
MEPSEAIEAGRRILEPILAAHGFSFTHGPSGRSSGGNFASASFVRGEWSLEFHYRYGLGMVSYHLAEAEVTHDRYMEAVIGRRGQSRYPGFSSEPLDAFRDLESDLQNYGQAFLNGARAEFQAIVKRAATLPRAKGLAGIP